MIAKFLDQIAMTTIGAFFLMAGVWFIHKYWVSDVPTLSYWHAFLIDFALGFFILTKVALARGFE